ncbi:MAG: dipeptide epimerase [Candidatus Marinimicrobia bacterium]|nr:dipeptide epimerase [Candidatus Neomarinimicrobiota bacterium]
MNLSYTQYDVRCTHPFGIARSTHEMYPEIFIYLEQDGIIGRGEASPSERYGESAEIIMKTIKSGIELPEKIESPDNFEKYVLHQCGGLKALEVAFSMAYLDWWTQSQNMAMKDYFGVNVNVGPHTSFTIAIGDMDLIAQKVAEAKPYHILKVKLGSDNDKEIIHAIRAETDKVIRVDANEGWDLDTAVEMCSWLADNNVEFVEQPLPAEKVHETAELMKKSPLPLIADENCLYPENIPEIAHAFDGINIKLMKCGSMLKAKEMIDMARERDLQIMLGCMVESSIGITAAAHLSPLVDYVDLDGNLLIDNDPYIGVQIEEGRVIIPDGNGLGVQLDSTVNGLK